MKFTYSPRIFDVADEAAARRIILTPDGRSTADRWALETPGLAALAGAALGLSANSTVLDYGCGIGRMAKALIDRFGCRVLGVDISAKMREMAPAYVRSERFEVLSREQLLERDPRCDSALAIWVLQHCHQPAKDCEVIRRSLAPHGRFLVVNNDHRAVPVAERPWVNDGLDVGKLLAATFTEIERGNLPAELLGDALAACTFWAVYGRKQPEN